MGKNKSWSVEELDFVRNHPELTYVELSGILNRSVDAIKQKVYKLKLRPTLRWSKDDEDWLKENLDLPYSELSKKLNRSVRAIKHKLHYMGLVRGERRRWVKEELDFLRNHPEKSASELSRMLGRSSFQVAKKLREIRGTASRKFKVGWDAPSRELAYFIGMLCSDGGVYRYKFELAQAQRNIEYIYEIEKIFKRLFGLPHRIFSRYIDGCKYTIFESYSVEFLKQFGTDEDVVAGKLKHDGEWIKFVKRKFSWVFGDEFFWYFLGGLFDGDGCCSVKKRVGGSRDYPVVSIAIAPKLSRDAIKMALLYRGFNFVENKTGLTLNGGVKKIDEFLNKVKNVIGRKNVRSISSKTQ